MGFPFNSVWFRQARALEANQNRRTITGSTIYETHQTAKLSLLTSNKMKINNPNSTRSSRENHISEEEKQQMTQIRRIQICNQKSS